MGKYLEKKKEILAAHGTSTVCNRAMFNQLFTAMVNDPDFVSVEYAVKQGELQESTSKPVEGFRKAVIGSVATAAGADSAEVKALVEKHEFPVIPAYEVVANVLEEYTTSGKAFRMPRRKDIQGTLKVTTEEEKVKSHNNPRSKTPGESAKITKRYSAYRKYRMESKCPANLTETVNN